MGFILANWKWLFSGLALVIYVVIQHALYISLLKACREFKSALDSANTDPAREAGGFVWLRDVRTMFSQDNGTWIENSPLPRDAVIDSLDNEIWRTSRYSALQRWGLAAPLIGVILSALGFMVSPPELTSEVRDIMSKLGPLFVGVFVGALMALINQVYLHFAAMELGRVRAKAVRWFDEVVWKAIRQNANNALGQAAAATQSSAKYLETSSMQLATSNISYRDSLLELNRQLAHVRAAAQSTSTTFDTFTTTFGEMTDQIRASIRNLSSLNATAAAVENSSAAWNAAAASVTNASTAIEASSQKLSETCGKFSTNFDDMHRTMKEDITGSTTGLLAVVNNLTEPVRKLEGSIQQMQTNTDRHSELSAALSTAVKQSEQFLMERMALNADEAELQKEMANRVRMSIDSMRQLTETAGAVNNTGTALNQAANGLQGSSATIESALKNLLDTCNAFSAHCAKLQTNMNSSVSDATSGLQTAARDLANPIQSLNCTISRISTSTENHAEFSERLDHVAKQAERFLEDRVQATTDESARVSRIEGTEKRLEETSRILSDSATTMRDLQRGLDALVEELKIARQSKDGRGRWLSWLSKPRGSTNPADLRNDAGAVDKTLTDAKRLE